MATRNPGGRPVVPDRSLVRRRPFRPICWCLRASATGRRGPMTKSAREIMEIFEAYDLTETVWSAAVLSGHDPKTVKRYVQARDSGRNPFEREPRPKMIDSYLEKIEEWVEQSKATIRADVAHDRLTSMGYPGSPRSTRRAVNAAKTTWKSGRRR